MVFWWVRDLVLSKNLFCTQLTLRIFSPQSNGVHAEFRGVFLGAPAVRRGHGGRLCRSLVRYSKSSPGIVLDLGKIFLEPELQPPQVANSLKLKNSAKLRVYSVTLR